MAKPQLAVRTSRTFSPSSIVSGSFRHFDSSVFAAAWPTARSALDEAIGLRTRLDAAPPHSRRLRRDIRHRPRGRSSTRIPSWSSFLDRGPAGPLRGRPCDWGTRDIARFGPADRPMRPASDESRQDSVTYESASAAGCRRRGELTRLKTEQHGVRRFAATPGK